MDFLRFERTCKMTYGVPYRGSKNKIADWVVDHLPNGKTLVDLFAGGCAVTHAAILAGKWENFIINDLGDAPEVFENAVKGKYANEKRWISREDFFKLKDSDPYVSIVWSFGNNRRDYLYGKDIEPIKKAIHYAMVFNDYSLMNQLKESNKNERLVSRERTESLQSLQSLQRLQSLQSLQRLQSLQSLQSLEQFSTDYQNVEIYKDSVIYCDIPYEGTDGYNGIDFDFERFYSWCEKQTEPVFISSYKMPEDRFICIATFEHRSILSTKANNKVLEKVFIPKHQASSYRLPGSLFNFDEM